MPNCFKLINLDTGKVESLADVDDKMCEHFGVDSDPDVFYKGWVDREGFEFAMGTTYARFIEIFGDTTIMDWLLANYSVDAWSER